MITFIHEATLCFSQTGKRLVAKCHSLMMENEEIGRMLSSGFISKLEGELALEKQLVRISKRAEESLYGLIIFEYHLDDGCSLLGLQ